MSTGMHDYNRRLRRWLAERLVGGEGWRAPPWGAAGEAPGGPERSLRQAVSSKELPLLRLQELWLGPTSIDRIVR